MPTNLPLSLLRNDQIEARLPDYPADEIEAELERVYFQIAADATRRNDLRYGGLVSTPEFWQTRVDLLRSALS